MFDYMIRILPNGRILVRNTASKDSEVLKATEVSAYLEKALEAQIEAQEEEDFKTQRTRKQIQEDYEEWYSERNGGKKDD